METLNWNLTELFENHTSFYESIENVKRMLLDIKEYETKEIDTSCLLLEILDKKWIIKELVNNILVYGSLQYYKNVNDEICIELKNKAESLHSEATTSLKFIDLKIIALGKEKVFSLLNENADLKIYALEIANLFRLQEHIQNGDTQDKIQQNQDFVKKQNLLYDSLLKNMEYGFISVEGKRIEITSTNFRKYISARDRETRKQTYLLVNQAFLAKQNDYAELLNSIYQTRIESSYLEMYNSVLEKVLFEENIDSKIISTLIDSVHSHLFLIQKYLNQKAKMLHIPEPHLYDFDVPLDNDVKITYTLEEAIVIIKEALKPLGEEYLKIVDLLLNGHIDAELDSNKHQFITFSWHTYSFMNFRGAYVDLKNMIHEIGHIVNYYLSKQNQPFLYEDSSIFVGETASLVNEILLNKYLYCHAKTKEEKLFYLTKEIENYFTSVFKQTMYTEFENELYNQGEFNAEILNTKYSEIIKKYYGNAICYDDVSFIEWARLGHLYRWSYYPYKYATGLLMASHVVQSLLNDKTLSKEEYLKFLSSGSSQYSLDLLKILHIDLTNSVILNEGFKIMEQAVLEFEQFLK